MDHLTNRIPPIVQASVSHRTRSGTWIIELLCPYCEKRHTHGGGSGETPEIAGHRAQHCDLDAARDMPGYVLAPASAEIEWFNERLHAHNLLVGNLDAIEHAAQTRERERVASAAALNDEFERLISIVDKPHQRPVKSSRNAAYLAGWADNRKGAGK